MHLPTRRAIFGLVASSLLVASLPARADGFDPDGLVRFGDTPNVTYEDWVSTDPLSTVIVRKIEGGRLSTVTVTRTATGTYSSDGIASPNVQYPGVIEHDKPFSSFSFSSWDNGRWTRLDTASAHSFVSITSYKRRNGETRTSTCISTTSPSHC